jgi:4-diphosphocytidyl-2-C-methyl-D-erythritol kinase
MRIVTPAKINLTLEIVGKRPDGFHDLATWMLPIGLTDHLAIEEAPETSFTSNIPELGNDPSNLVIGAVEEFGKDASIKSAYRISLEKKIPMGAGLGGGSSNAAGALRLLNRIHGDPLSETRLHKLAARLGSDVAFFVSPKSAWCTGRGEKLEPREFPAGYYLFLAKPDFGVSTAGAYRAYANLPLDKKRGEEQKTPWGVLRNDLEPAVFPKYVLLPIIKEWMKRQAETLFSLMSGSGSTLFAVVKSRGDGELLVDRFQIEFGRTIWTTVVELNPPLARISHAF